MNHNTSRLPVTELAQGLWGSTGGTPRRILMQAFVLVTCRMLRAPVSPMYITRMNSLTLPVVPDNAAGEGAARGTRCSASVRSPISRTRGTPPHPRGTRARAKMIRPGTSLTKQKQKRAVAPSAPRARNDARREGRRAMREGMRCGATHLRCGALRCGALRCDAMRGAALRCGARHRAAL